MTNTNITIANTRIIFDIEGEQFEGKGEVQVNVYKNFTNNYYNGEEAGITLNGFETDIKTGTLTLPRNLNSGVLDNLGKVAGTFTKFAMLIFDPNNTNAYKYKITSCYIPEQYSTMQLNFINNPDGIKSIINFNFNDFTEIKP